MTLTLELKVLIWPMNFTVLWGGGGDDSEITTQQPKTSKRGREVEGEGDGEGKGEGCV